MWEVSVLIKDENSVRIVAMQHSKKELMKGLYLLVALSACHVVAHKGPEIREKCLC